MKSVGSDEQCQDKLAMNKVAATKSASARTDASATLAIFLADGPGGPRGFERCVVVAGAWWFRSNSRALLGQ